MAYADTRGRMINPAGIGATLLVNAGIGFALLVLGATIVATPKAETGSIKGLPTKYAPPPKPVSPEEHIKKKDGPIIDSATKAPPVERTQAPSNLASNDAARPADPEPLDMGLIGGGGDIGTAIPDPLPLPIEPIITHTPVRTGSALLPNYKSAFQPPYPRGLQHDGVEGYATVRVLIGIDGRVKQIEAVGASNPDFMASTRDHALKKWRFRPATEDGAPVESWREMTVRFVMPDGRDG
jgi:protein TonB